MGKNWLISSQSAFFASLLVTISSFFGYKKLIEKKVASGDIPKEDRDDFEIIDDKHDLYKEEDFQEVIKQERTKIAFGERCLEFFKIFCISLLLYSVKWMIFLK